MINSENLLEYEITAELESKVDLLRKGTDRIGKVIFSGSNVKESVLKCLNFIEHTKIKID